jgi:nascent polypeptide-associated complex subunit beta
MLIFEFCRRDVPVQYAVNQIGPDLQLQSTLKKLGVNNILDVVEVTMFKDDGTMIHFQNPMVQTAMATNILSISGHCENKELFEMLPGAAATDAVGDGVGCGVGAAVGDGVGCGVGAAETDDSATEEDSDDDDLFDDDADSSEEEGVAAAEEGGVAMETDGGQRYCSAKKSVVLRQRLAALAVEEDSDDDDGPDLVENFEETATELSMSQMLFNNN